MPTIFTPVWLFNTAQMLFLLKTIAYLDNFAACFVRCCKISEIPGNIEGNTFPGFIACDQIPIHLELYPRFEIQKDHCCDHNKQHRMSTRLEPFLKNIEVMRHFFVKILIVVIVNPLKAVS